MELPSKPPISVPPNKPEQLPRHRRLGFVDLLVVALGSLLALPGVLLGTITSGAWFLGPVVAGPLIEEILKPAGLIGLLTRRPDLKLGVTTGVLVGAFSGLVFAAVENAIYLVVYVPKHDHHVVVWRWTVCVGVHMVCSAIVGYGLARSSGGTGAAKTGEYRLLGSAAPHLLDEPRERSGVFQGISLKCLMLAVVLHGAYNLAVILFERGQ